MVEISLHDSGIDDAVIVGRLPYRISRGCLLLTGVTVITVAFGLDYNLFSEWLNTVIRAASIYSNLMPIIPILDAGQSPVLLWIFISIAVFFWASHPFETDRI